MASLYTNPPLTLNQKQNVDKVESTSDNWDSTYTTVNSNSGNWDSTSDITYLSGQIDGIEIPDLTLVESVSSNWDSTYTTVQSNSAIWGQSTPSTNNFSQPTSANFTTPFVITSATPVETYVDMTSGMELDFNRSTFLTTEAVFGVLYIKPNAFSLTATANVVGLSTLSPLVTGSYNTIVYNSAPGVSTMEVR